MSSFIVAFDAVVPITVVVLLGYLFQQKGIVRESSFQDFNKVVFRLLLPTTLFKNMVEADWDSSFNITLIGYSVIFMTAIILLGMLYASKRNITVEQKGILVQGIFRSNFIVLGLPIVESIYGSKDLRVVTIMIAIFVPYMNIMAALILQKYATKKTGIVDMIKGLFKNPMVIGALCGFIYTLLKLPVFSLETKILTTITKMTTSLSLFILGGTFHFTSLKKNIHILCEITIARLVLVPLVAVLIGVILGFRGIELVTLLVLFGTPIAVSVYPMSEQMGFDGELAGQAVLVTTVCVLLALFVFIFVLDFIRLI